jgi:hypothetical protein
MRRQAAAAKEEFAVALSPHAVMRSLRKIPSGDDKGGSFWDVEATMRAWRASSPRL